MRRRAAERQREIERDRHAAADVDVALERLKSLRRRRRRDTGSAAGCGTRTCPPRRSSSSGVKPETGLLILTSTACITPPVGSLTVPCTVPAPPVPARVRGPLTPIAATAIWSAIEHERKTRRVSIGPLFHRCIAPSTLLAAVAIWDDRNRTSGRFVPANARRSGRRAVRCVPAVDNGTVDYNAAVRPHAIDHSPARKRPLDGSCSRAAGKGVG